MDIYIEKAENLLNQNSKLNDKLMILGVFIELYNTMVKNALKYNENIARNTRNIFINVLEFCLINTTFLRENTSYQAFMKNFLAILSRQEDIIKIPENNLLINHIQPKIEEYYIAMPYIDVIDKKEIDFEDKTKYLRILQILIDVFYKNINNQYNKRLALILKKNLVNYLTLSLPTILEDNIDTSLYRKQIKQEIKKFIDIELEKETIDLIPSKDMLSREILKHLTEEEKTIYLQLKNYYLACYLPDDIDLRPTYKLSDEINMSVREYQENKINLDRKIKKLLLKKTK